MKKLGITAVFTLLLSLIFTSCYEPSPLYGTWADNDGNKITFINDGTFNAYVLDSTGYKVNYSGDYSVIDNVLVFNYTSSKDEDGGTFSINTEWDIRGSMLYLSWTYTDSTLGVKQTVNLTLYHISKQEIK